MKIIPRGAPDETKSDDQQLVERQPIARLQVHRRIEITTVRDIISVVVCGEFGAGRGNPTVKNAGDEPAVMELPPPTKTNEPDRNRS